MYYRWLTWTHVVYCSCLYCDICDAVKYWTMYHYCLHFFLAFLYLTVFFSVTFFSHVIVLGDVNTSHRPIDHCDPCDSVSERLKYHINVFLVCFVNLPYWIGLQRLRWEDWYHSPVCTLKMKLKTTANEFGWNQRQVFSKECKECYYSF